MKLGRLKLNLHLPLLGKELVEQAARRRTYVLRVTYACLLFGTAILLFSSTLATRRVSSFAILGHGREMFETIVFLQFIGIYLFMPAMCSGVLTSEKERNTLGLLMLTRLGPWAIVSEKLLGRLVPMLMYLLLSLPLLAFAYSLGGISQNHLWGGVWLLVITALQVGALSLMCSAYFRTTVAAFIGTYVFGLMLYYLLPISDGLGIVNISEYTAFMFFGPYIFTGLTRSILSFPDLLGYSLTILFSAGLFFVLARVFLVRRAFAQPRHLILNVFRWLDRLFWKANQNRFTRGIVLTKQDVALPGDDPLAWRETTKTSLGTTRYLFRVFIAVEIPVATVCLLDAGYDGNYVTKGASVSLFLLWFLAIMLVSVKSASLIAGERSHQTLDVLMVTPLTSRDIILQKLCGVRRLILVLFVPFLTIYLFKTWLLTTGPAIFGYSAYDASSFVYLLCSLLSFVVYLPMVSWLSLLIGLRVRSQTRAIVGSLAAIIAWCVLPLIAFFLYTILYGSFFGQPRVSLLVLLSPATIVLMNENFQLHTFEFDCWASTVVILNFTIYGLAYYSLRQFCLINADRLLGRSHGERSPLGLWKRHRLTESA